MLPISKWTTLKRLALITSYKKKTKIPAQCSLKVNSTHLTSVGILLYMSQHVKTFAPIFFIRPCFMCGSFFTDYVRNKVLFFIDICPSVQEEGEGFSLPSTVSYLTHPLARYIGGSRGGRQGRAPPPPLGPKISLFSCSFREKLAK